MLTVSPYVFPLLERPHVNRDQHFKGGSGLAKKQMRRILVAVCDYYNLDPRNVRGPARHREPLMARQMFIYLVLKYTRIAVTRIGAYLGGRHHSSVINARETLQNLLDTEPDIRRDLMILEARLQNIF